ncbi:hypothetical protein G9A89_012712 [Geosiphon pyriformis]|nr:hypothetical protein G9A89_012712 [Geosiphon pyriformis]
MANAKIKGAMPSEILEIKNNSPEPVNIVLIPNPDAFLNIETGPEKFHEHYQNLAPTKKEQEQCLKKINTQLCDYCLILCDFQYCNKCNLIYNSPPCMIYTIPEEKNPISSCTLESESTFNPDLNSNNDDNKNNSSSFIQIDNDNNDNSDLDLKPKQYIMLPDLTKEQELKWFNDNNKSIMPECTHNTNIAQTIFLPLVKIAQLVSVGNRKKLGIIAKKIQGFGLTGRIDVPVNMAEKKIVDKGEIISICQSISIVPYDQYIITIKRKVKDQVQIFEAEATLCESEKIGLVNLHIPAKNYKHIKISIYNNIEDTIKIPKRTTIGYLTTEVENQLSNTILDFSQLCRYVDITSQTIYRQKECYLLQSEQLKQMNLRNLDLLQCMQFKILLNNFNNIFVSKNKFGRTDIIQHQIKTGKTMPIKQKTYRILPASHKIIHQKINQMLDNRPIQPSMSS